MSAKSIYRPFFYLLKHIPSGKLYAGSHTATVKKTANPENLMKPNGYLTSSIHIHSLIKEGSLDDFAVIEIKEFSTKNETYDYETEYLNSVNAADSDLYINTHNNHVLSYDSEKFIERMMSKHGVDNAMKSEEIRERAWDTVEQKYGKRYTFQNDSIREKSKDTLLERYGVDNCQKSPEIRKKTENTNKERFGGNAPACSKEVQEKMRRSSIEKYGVDNIAKTPERKAKASEYMKKMCSRDIYVKTIELYRSKGLKLPRGSSMYSDQRLQELIDSVV